MRTIIDLPDEQISALAQLCKEQGISRAEAMRRALAKMLEEQKKASRESAFGAWQKRDVDSRKFVDQLRDEWFGGYYQ